MPDGYELNWNCGTNPVREGSPVGLRSGRAFLLVTGDGRGKVTEE